MSINGKNPKATDNFLDVRAIFTKMDRARYISHLDLYRAMQRAFKRAKIPVWYTQGFNQHLYITFGLALSLGFESFCEVMEFRIVEDIPLDELEERIKKVMPEGLQIVKLYYPVMKMKDIAFSEFSIKFTTENPIELKSKFDKFIHQDRIIVYKKNKKKQLIETDLKPHIQVISSTIEENIFKVVVRLPAGNTLNINPTLISDKFIQEVDIPIESIHYTREKILSINGEDFI
ncbi:MAG: TIGR03936 family radical SAM-associated protein [Oscillospiraceae bacterium]